MGLLLTESLVNDVRLDVLDGLKSSYLLDHPVNVGSSGKLKYGTASGCRRSDEPAPRDCRYLIAQDAKRL